MIVVISDERYIQMVLSGQVVAIASPDGGMVVVTRHNAKIEQEGGKYVMLVEEIPPSQLV